MHRAPAILFLFISLAHLAFTPPSDARPCLRVQDAFPASPAGQCAKAFFSAAADPRPDVIRSFEERWASASRLAASPIEARIASFPAIASDLGGGRLAIVRLVEADPFTAFATTAGGEELAFEFHLSTAEVGKLDSIRIMPAAEASAGSAPMTAELRAATVESAARALREGYVFPAIGAKMADALLAHLKAGDYDAITSETALASRLTDDCRAISHDKHLAIRPAPRTAAAGPARPDPRSENFGFKRVEILPGNVGYLRFDVFIASEEAYSVASSAMNFLAGADAIVFDLRRNGGGSPDMIRFLTSYLFESSTHLNDMVDREGKVVQEFWTLDKVPGRRPRAGVPVYVLTSARTFSGAEEFSYNLQNLERATIVGETTGGGAHPVRGARLNDRFQVRIPHMRARNPITRTNWEGSGVSPDVHTPAETALDKALNLAREAIKQKN